MDNYQPIFDAVRSRISGFDGQSLIDAIAARFECSHQIEILYHDALNVIYEQQRPSVLFKPTLSIDGNQFCALYGKDLQGGIAGFGDTVAEAMLDFDKSWNNFSLVKEQS